MEFQNPVSAAGSLLCIMAFVVILLIVLYKYTSARLASYYRAYFCSSKSRREVAYASALLRFQDIKAQTEILQNAWKDSLLAGCRWSLREEKLLRSAVETLETVSESLKIWESELEHNIWKKKTIARWARSKKVKGDEEKGLGNSGSRRSRRRALSTAQREFFRRLAEREELSQKLKQLHAEILSKAVSAKHSRPYPALTIDGKHSRPSTAGTYETEYSNISMARTLVGDYIRPSTAQTFNSNHSRPSTAQTLNSNYSHNHNRNHPSTTRITNSLPSSLNSELLWDEEPRTVIVKPLEMLKLPDSAFKHASWGRLNLDLLRLDFDTNSSR